MGTTWTVKLVADARVDLAFFQTAIQRVLDRVVAQMSTWEPGSDLSRFNAAAAGSWRVLPQEFFDVLVAALDLAQATAGAYDPSAGPLVDCWGFGPQPRDVLPPTPSEISLALARVGWQALQLDRENRRAYQPGGRSIDLSSIAKGYGVDAVAAQLEALGMPHHLVEVGGELRGQGCKPDGAPWWVGLEQPPGAEDESPFVLALDGLAIATSGDYRRYVDVGAQRYAHTLDPRSGWPVAHQPALASVTVIHDRCMQADALATALTVLGAAAGFEYAERHRLAARFLSRHDGGLEERLTSALTALQEN